MLQQIIEKLGPKGENWSLLLMALFDQHGKSSQARLANGPLYYDVGPAKPGMPEGAIGTPNVGPDISFTSLK